MSNMRTTVVLKTDIVDSTPNVARLSQTEMGRQRKQHLRSYLYGNDLHVTFFLEELARLASSGREVISVVVSGKVKQSAKGTIWENNFSDLGLNLPMDHKLHSIMDEYGAYWFITTSGFLDKSLSGQ